jgi:hypothetical protein
MFNLNHSPLQCADHRGGKQIRGTDFMDRRTQRRLEMGARALEFSLAHPDDTPGIATAVEQLKALLSRADQLAREQEAGIVQVHAATIRKRELARLIRRGQLVHLARVAELAAKEVPELAQKFDLPRVPRGYLPFRNICRTMLEVAQQNQEALRKYGLSDRVLTGLAAALDDLDRAVARGIEGRRIHITARANLDVVGDGIIQFVEAIDGSNRVRFVSQPDLLATWNAASSVVRTHTGGPADGRTDGDANSIKPAA